jgi:hypothetical protein
VWAGRNWFGRQSFERAFVNTVISTITLYFKVTFWWGKATWRPSRHQQLWTDLLHSHNVCWASEFLWSVMFAPRSCNICKSNLCSALAPAHCRQLASRPAVTCPGVINKAATLSVILSPADSILVRDTIPRLWSPQRDPRLSRQDRKTAKRCSTTLLTYTCSLTENRQEGLH